MSDIHVLIPKIMHEVGAISKEGENKQQNYRFRGIDQLYNAIQPILVKHGVFCVPQVIDHETSVHIGKNQTGGDKTSFRTLLRVLHRFFAPDASYVDVITMGEGLDTSDKSSNKAMSAAMKYAFIELLSLPTLDLADSDRENGDTQRDKAAGLQARILPKPTNQVKHNPLGIVNPSAVTTPASTPPPFDPLGDYVIRVGKTYKDKKLKDMGPETCSLYLQILAKAFATSGEKPEGLWAEAIARMEAYVAQGKAV